MNHAETTKRSVDNDLYDRMADGWWRDGGFLNLLGTTVNPWRVPYFERILGDRLIEPHGTRVLDVGCGGGLLAEEITTMGYTVVGIDPSERSLDVARAHAAETGRHIDYLYGRGQHLPFDDETFDAVLCCDVLEHVEDWHAVIGEVARVLRPGGVFLYDTINRTFASWLRTIFIAQQCRWTRYAPPRTHVWRMFITPEELGASLDRHGLSPQPVVGTAA